LINFSEGCPGENLRENGKIDQIVSKL